MMLVMYVDGEETARVRVKDSHHFLRLVLEEVKWASLKIEKNTYRAPTGETVKFELLHEEGDDDTGTEQEPDTTPRDADEAG